MLSFTRKRLIVVFVFFTCAVFSGVRFGPGGRAQNRSEAVLAPAVTATMTAAATTDVGTNGAFINPGDTLRYTVTLSNTGPGVTDATNTIFTDNLTDSNLTLVPGSIKASPIAFDDTFTATGNVRIQEPAGSLTANDIRPVLGTNSGLTAVIATVSSANCTGSCSNNVTIASNGSFTYDPPAGFEGAGASADSFTYTVTDPDGLTGTGTVKIDVSGMIWFIDSSQGVNGDGRLTSPFNCLRGPQCFDTTTTGGAADDPGDNIFLYSGNYTGGFTLLATQKLIGQGASVSLISITGLTLAPNSDALLPTSGVRPTVTTVAAATNAITLGTGNTLRGFNIGNTTGVDISGTSFGTLTASEMALSGTGRPLSLMTGTMSATFDSVQSTSSTGGPAVSLTSVGGSTLITGAVTIDLSASQGIALQTNTGSFTVQGATNLGTTSGNASNDIRIDGGSGNVSFAGVTISDRNSQGINIFGSYSGAANFTNTTTINNQGSDGSSSLVISDVLAAGSVTFANLVINQNGTAANGVSISTNAGPVTITDGTIGGVSGTDVFVSGGGASVIVGADIANTAGRSVEILNRTGGSTVFSGNITDTGTGINVANNTAGSVDFSGATKTINTGVNQAVTLATNVGANVNFSGGGLDIDTTSGTGFNASGGGTIGVSGASNTINSGSGGAIVANGVALNATFASVTSTGGANGIGLTNVTGTSNFGTGVLSGATAATFLVSGGTVSTTYAGNVTQATAAQPIVGIANHSTGTISFQTGTLSASNGTGLQFSNADGTYNFNGTTNLTGGSRVDILAASGGTFGFASGTSITNGGGTASFNVNASTPGVTYSGTITTNMLRPVSISNAAAAGCGTVTFQTGNITATSGSNGILVNNCNAGTITFNNPAISLTTTTNAGVTLTGNSGTAAINFTPVAGNGLDVLTTTGKAFTATGAGTVKVTGSGNTLSTNTVGTGNTVLEVDGVTIGTGGLNFVSLNGNGNSSITKGVYLNNAGAGGLTVAGTGSAGSGGTLLSYTQKGVHINNTNNISLTNMNLSGNGTVNLDPAGTCGDILNGTNTNCAAGIDLQTVSTVTMSGVHVSGGVQVGLNGKGVTGMTLSNVEVNGVGNEANESGVQLHNLFGTMTWTSPNFHDNASRQLNVQNSTTTAVNLTINGGTFSNTAWPGSTTSAQGILFAGTNNANMTISVQNATIARNFGPAFNAISGTGATINSTLNGGSLIDNGQHFVVASTGNGNMTYALTNVATAWIDGTPITGHSQVTPISIFLGNPSSGTIIGNISNNVFGVAGNDYSSACFGGCNVISVNNGDSDGIMQATINNNTITRSGGGGINVTAGSGNATDSSTMRVRIHDNNLSTPDGNGTGLPIAVGKGASAGDTTTTCANVLNNTIAGTGGVGTWNMTNAIRIRNTGNTGAYTMPGYGGGATDYTAVTNYLNGRNTIVGAGNTSSVQNVNSFSNTPGGADCFAGGAIAAESGLASLALLSEPLSGAMTNCRSGNFAEILTETTINPSNENFFASGDLVIASGEADIASEPMPGAAESFEVGEISASAELIPVVAANEGGSAEVTESPTETGGILATLSNMISPTVYSQEVTEVAVAPEAGTVTVNGGGTGFTLPAGKSTIITFDAVISNPTVPAATFSVSTQGSVSGSGFGPILTDGDAGTAGEQPTTSVVVQPPTISKSFNPTSILLDQQSTLTLTINNANPGTDATAITFTDTFPANLVIANPANASTTCTGGMLQDNLGGTLDSGDLGIKLINGARSQNQSCTVTVDVRGTMGGSYPNTTGPISSFQGVTGLTSNTATLNVSVLTAASVSVSGRVLTHEGRGIRNAAVILTDSLGVSRRVRTGSLGAYQFDDVPVGQTYVITVASRRYYFAPQILTVLDPLTNVDFVAEIYLRNDGTKPGSKNGG